MDRTVENGRQEASEGANATGKKPFFSIIIPVYNVAPYLRECLDSVLAQTFPDWEAICVDDGSSDGSGAILDEYAAKDVRFRVIHQHNRGVGAARNAGLDAAKGGWVLFLDGDDLWHQELLGVVSRMIAKYPSEKLFRFGMEQFEGATWLGSVSEVYACGRIDITTSITMHDFRDFYFICFVYKRELFDGLRFPRYIRGEDRCVINQIQLQLVDSIVYTPGLFYGYRKRMGSAVNSVPTLQVLQDEMDHRLDIMMMIDNSDKMVRYAGDAWLEGYFTQSMYLIARTRKSDRAEAIRIWRETLYRLLRCKDLSAYGRFVAWSCSRLRCGVWDTLVCYIIPRLLDGVSPIRWLIRKIRNGR